MSAIGKQIIRRREVDGNIWLAHDGAENGFLATLPVKELAYEVLPSEEAVGRAMLYEIKSAVAAKGGSLVMILVGGRGGQALHRMLGAMAKTNEHDELFGRLHVFTQDALAPLRLDNGFGGRPPARAGRSSWPAAGR